MKLCDVLCGRMVVQLFCSPHRGTHRGMLGWLGILRARAGENCSPYLPARQALVLPDFPIPGLGLEKKLCMWKLPLLPLASRGHPGSLAEAS